MHPHPNSSTQNQNSIQSQQILSSNDSRSYHTTNNSQESEQHRTRKQSSINIHLLQSVILSNQDIIKSQSQQIKIMHTELLRLENQLQKEQIKNVKLQEQLSVISNGEELRKKLQSIQILQKHLHSMETELIEAKLQLAIKSSDSLEKDLLIRDLNQKNKILDEEMEKMTILSGGTDSNTNGEDTKKPLSKIQDKQPNTFTMIEINKQNLQQFIQPSQQSNQSIFNSLKNLIDSQIFKKSASSDAILKAWEKQVNQHILPKPKRFSFSSLYNKEVHLQKFLKETIVILKKYYGVPHTFRNKVWPFITQDRLGLSNALYIQLLQRRNKGWVAEKIKLQIQRDILRSFNGQGSKDKLLKIFEINLVKSKSETQDKSKFIRRTSVSTVGETQLLEGSVKSEKQQLPQESNKTELIDHKQQSLLDSSKSLQIPLNLDVHSPNNHPQGDFRIAQDVTQVLELFYIYRPDIGFVQGMTYPVIMLTLAVGKFNSFRILCNILLCSDFFRKMITFEPNFINYFCRIFDQLLLSFHLNLYNRVVRQFDIRSQVFLVDWFFTFFSRGITPITILRIWDLILYHYSINPKVPQIVLYRLSLIIFQLLQPIIMQANYQQTIRAIRDYPKKIDQEQLIRKLYDSMKDSSMVQKFEEKYLKVKQRVEKRYQSEMENI